MADDGITSDSFPTEYDRPAVYGRPLGASLVQVIERVTKGQTPTNAMRASA